MFTINALQHRVWAYSNAGPIEHGDEYILWSNLVCMWWLHGFPEWILGKHFLLQWESITRDMINIAHNSRTSQNTLFIELLSPTEQSGWTWWTLRNHARLTRCSKPHTDGDDNDEWLCYHTFPLQGELQSFALKRKTFNWWSPQGHVGYIDVLSRVAYCKSYHQDSHTRFCPYCRGLYMGVSLWLCINSLREQSKGESPWIERQIPIYGFMCLSAHC